MGLVRCASLALGLLAWGAAARAEEPEPWPSADDSGVVVVAATTDIRAGKRIRARDVELVSLPSGFVVEENVRGPTLAPARASADIVAGELLRTERVAVLDRGRAVTLTMPSPGPNKEPTGMVIVAAAELLPGTTLTPEHLFLVEADSRALRALGCRWATSCTAAYEQRVGRVVGTTILANEVVRIERLAD